MLFLNLGTPEIIILCFASVPVLLMVYCLIDIMRSDFREQNTKLLWILIVLFAPLVGGLIYLLMGNRNKV